MIILILGPQGSGKGTQAVKIADYFNLFYLSTGQMFREMAKRDPGLHEKLKTGELLEDDFVVESLKKYLKERDVDDDFIIDGTPRSSAQYESIKKWLSEKGKKVDMAIVLGISRKESIRRLSNRRMDPKTGKIYNLVTEPKPGADVDVSRLVQREDDKPEAINERLNEYEQVTKPLLAMLAKDGILYEVDGEREIESIFKEMKEIIKKNG